jgi:hypothetical protein
MVVNDRDRSKRAYLDTLTAQYAVFSQVVEFIATHHVHFSPSTGRPRATATMVRDKSHGDIFHRATETVCRVTGRMSQNYHAGYIVKRGGDKRALQMFSTFDLDRIIAEDTIRKQNGTSESCLIVPVYIRSMKVIITFDAYAVSHKGSRADPLKRINDLSYEKRWYCSVRTGIAQMHLDRNQLALVEMFVEFEPSDYFVEFARHAYIVIEPRRTRAREK